MTARPARARLADLPRLLSIEQIADHLGVSVRHVRRLVAERRIPYIKWGHLLRFDPTEIDDWLKMSRVEPTRVVRHG
jgi:excisionase family DNA binding protein